MRDIGSPACGGSFVLKETHIYLTIFIVHHMYVWIKWPDVGTAKLTTYLLEPELLHQKLSVCCTEMSKTN